MRVSGAGGDLEHEALFVGLAEKVRDLADGRALTIAQFTTDGMVIWDVRRALVGPPR
jgi:hypothetical protein